MLRLASVIAAAMLLQAAPVDAAPNVFWTFGIDTPIGHQRHNAIAKAGAEPMVAVARVEQTPVQGGLAPTPQAAAIAQAAEPGQPRKI